MEGRRKVSLRENLHKMSHARYQGVEPTQHLKNRGENNERKVKIKDWNQ
jgi:hypothetical protein